MEPVRWGVLGVAQHFRLRVFIPTRDSETVEIYGIASRTLEKAKKAAEEFGIPAAYGSYEELLEDKAIEAVFIPLPNNMHLKWIKKTADAGKHILCEKPLAMNAQEVAEAIEYAEKKGVMLMEAFMHRLHPQWQRARDLAFVGEIGTVQSVNTSFFYSLSDPGNIRNILEAGGGAIRDIGCYAVNSARFILNSEPLRVVSLIKRDPDFKTDILSSCILDFGSTRSEFTVATKTFSFQRVDIHGSDGRITIRNPFNIFPDVPVRFSVINAIGKRDLHIGPADQYALEFDAFSKALRVGKGVPTPPEDALKNQKVLDAIFKSEKTGNWEEIA